MSKEYIIYATKKNLNCGGSNIDSPRQIKSGKEWTKKNNNGNCFQYAINVALSHEQVKKDLQRMRRNCFFINQCEWKDINANFTEVLTAWQISVPI